jgi:hypothetical protein
MYARRSASSDCEILAPVAPEVNEYLPFILRHSEYPAFDDLERIAKPENLARALRRADLCGTP